jgi:dephospho-CoA kinase
VVFPNHSDLRHFLSADVDRVASKVPVKPRILGIAGHIRSGKTHAAQYIGSTIGAPVFRNSQPIEEVITRIGSDADRQLFAKLGLAILDVFGRDLIARHWLRIIETGGAHSLYIVEGIRYEEELVLYKQVADFTLLGIQTMDAERYRRAAMAQDRQKDAGKSFEQFLELKELPNESQVDYIVGRADAIIENDGSIDAFNESIEATLRRLYS